MLCIKIWQNSNCVLLGDGFCEFYKKSQACGDSKEKVIDTECNSHENLCEFLVAACRSGWKIKVDSEKSCDKNKNTTPKTSSDSTATRNETRNETLSTTSFNSTAKLEIRNQTSTTPSNSTVRLEIRNQTSTTQTTNQDIQSSMRLFKKKLLKIFRRLT